MRKTWEMQVCVEGKAPLGTSTPAGSGRGRLKGREPHMKWNLFQGQVTSEPTGLGSAGRAAVQHLRAQSRVDQVLSILSKHARRLSGCRLQLTRYLEQLRLHL